MSSKLFTIGILILLALAFSIFIFIDSFKGKINEATGLAVSIESFPTYLETHPAIESLPKSSIVELKIGETTYEIEGRNVHKEQVIKEKDVKITLPSGYETIIGEIGLCNAIKKANSEKDLKVDFYTSKPMLFLKYRKLLKYRECIK